MGNHGGGHSWTLEILRTLETGTKGIAFLYREERCLRDDKQRRMAVGLCRERAKRLYKFVRQPIREANDVGTHE